MRRVTAVLGVLAWCGAADAQYAYSPKYYPSYGHHYYRHQPYYPQYYPPYCPPAKAEPVEDAFDLLLKEAKLRKAISELPPDQRDAMLRRLGWYREPERPAPGGVPPLTTDEVERLRGKLNPK